MANTDEAIQYELYKDEMKIPINNLKTEQLVINGGEKIEHKYKLKVIYDYTKGAVGNDIFEDAQIKVHSEQEKI